MRYCNVMSRTTIEFEPIPPTSFGEFQDIAGELALQNAVYIVPAGAVELFGYNPATDHADILAGHLTRSTNNEWVAEQPEERTADTADLGLHGNPVPDGHCPNRVHYHKNYTGIIEVTFGVARPAYLEEDDRKGVEKYLDELLQNNQTDTHYVDPDSFKRGTVGPADATIFRLNGPDGTPHLHNFRTVERPRASSIIRIIEQSRT